MISKEPPAPKSLDLKKTLTLMRVQPLSPRSPAGGSDSEAWQWCLMSADELIFKKDPHSRRLMLRVAPGSFHYCHIQSLPGETQLWDRVLRKTLLVVMAWFTSDKCTVWRQKDLTPVLPVIYWATPTSIHYIPCQVTIDYTEQSGLIFLIIIIINKKQQKQKQTKKNPRFSAPYSSRC